MDRCGLRRLTENGITLDEDGRRHAMTDTTTPRVSDEEIADAIDQECFELYNDLRALRAELGVLRAEIREAGAQWGDGPRTMKATADHANEWFPRIWRAMLAMSGRYPTEQELAAIRVWDVHDVPGLFDYVREIWNWPDMATMEGGMLRLATGGWSGNEDIIGALHDNLMFWMLCWQSSERGGLHWFKPWPAPVVTPEGRTP
jgi:hypothetical protein